jgi:sedoheptulokinase
LVGARYLYVGSALCGGRAFEIAKEFFSRCAQFMTGISPEGPAAYAAMDRLLAGAEPQGETLVFDPRFAGTRRDPALRASVTRLSADNFTPEHLLRGLVRGMAAEIYEFYRGSGIRRDLLVGAGNGLRKNAALRQALEQCFGMPLRVAPFREEAAHGAAKMGGGS